MTYHLRGDPTEIDTFLFASFASLFQALDFETKREVYKYSILKQKTNASNRYFWWYENIWKKPAGLFLHP